MPCIRLFLKMEAIIDFTKFLLPQTNIPSCNGRAAMVHYFAELQESHFTTTFYILVFIYFPRPSLSE